MSLHTKVRRRSPDSQSLTGISNLWLLRKLQQHSHVPQMGTRPGPKGTVQFPLHRALLPVVSKGSTLLG